jgi:hypothetical protein
MPRPILKLFGAIFALGCVLPGGRAEAYPNAVIFAPSGEAKAQGDVSVLMYTAYFGGSPLTWAGLNVGILPTFAYGGSGLSFGGMEVGLDVISMAGLTPANKPVFNAKAQLLQESGLVPSVALGLANLAFSAMDTSLSATYAVATKTLSWSEIPLGRITLGGGLALAGSPAAFRATLPFSGPSQGFLMGGYESPAWGPLYAAVDHIGGVSELGSTNVGLNVLLNPGTYLGLGYTMGNDRSLDPADAVYLYLSSAWSMFGQQGGR